jgi:hypothetical protein
MNFFLFLCRLCVFISHIILIAPSPVTLLTVPTLPFLRFLFTFFCSSVICPVDLKELRLPGQFKIKLDYRNFFGGRPLFHVLSWSCCLCLFEGSVVYTAWRVFVSGREKSSYLMKQ